MDNLIVTFPPNRKRMTNHNEVSVNPGNHAGFDDELFIMSIEKLVL